MNFIKFIVFIVAATFSTWVFAQNNAPTKSIEELSSLTIKLAELEAEKYALEFLFLPASEKSENLRPLQIIENDIRQKIKDKAFPTIFDEQINNLDQKNQTLIIDILDKKKR